MRGTMRSQILHPLRLQRRDGQVATCAMCQRYCAIRPGQTGYCSTVVNRDGELFSTIYGLVAEHGVDPIEKKPVRCYRPGTRVLTLGSFGCNLRCHWCQNWEIAFVDASTPIPARRYSPDEVVSIALSAGCAGIAWSYNEPGIWIDFIVDCAREARSAGLYTVMVTNCLLSHEALGTLAGLIDIYRADFKTLDNALLRAHAQLPSSAGICDSLLAMGRCGAHLELVTVVMPELFADDHLARMAAWIAEQLGTETPWHLTRYVPYARLSTLPPTSAATLERAGAIAVAAGLHRVFVGDWYEAIPYEPGCLL